MITKLQQNLLGILDYVASLPEHEEGGWAYIECAPKGWKPFKTATVRSLLKRGIIEAEIEANLEVHPNQRERIPAQWDNPRHMHPYQIFFCRRVPMHRRQAA